jgi:hypothetical protein
MAEAALSLSPNLDLEHRLTIAVLALTFGQDGEPRQHSQSSCLKLTSEMEIRK